MKPELEALLDLQEIDLEIRKLDEEKKESPKRLMALEERVQAKESELGLLKERRDEVLLHKKEIEEELEIETSRLGKSQQKLTAIKTNREYQALIKEIEEIKKANKGREEEILSADEELERLAGEIEEKEKEAKEASVEAQAERKQLDEVLSKLEHQMKKLSKERETRAQKVDKALLNRYNFLKDKRAGIAVAAVTAEVCTGCHMNIPPQLFNDLLRDQKVHTCPSCQRLIYALRDQDKE